MKRDDETKQATSTILFLQIFDFSLSISELFFDFPILFLYFAIVMKKKENTSATILSITGSDSGGGAGIQQDIQTISALGGYAVTAITSITVQNTLGIQGFYDLPADMVKGQIEAIINDIEPSVVKIGMIRNLGILKVIVDMLVKYKPPYIIYDATIHTANGEQLLPDDVIIQIRQQLLPLCQLIITRKPDAGILHPKRDKVYVLSDQQQHGLSNGFSSAVAVYLSQGFPVEEAIAKAEEYARANITRHSELQGRSATLYNEFLDCIDKHLHKNHDINFYSECLNVSSRYLAQVTHRITHQSPKQILDQKVIDALKRELLTTTRNIQEIAWDFGFSSQQHFTKFFKKQTGLTPTEFRKSN